MIIKKKGQNMKNLDEVDKEERGWGLELNSADRKGVIDRMLYRFTRDEFDWACDFIFDNPGVSVPEWSGSGRSVVIIFADGSQIEASA